MNTLNKNRNSFRLVLLHLMSYLMVSIPSTALAQMLKDQIVGTWKIVSLNVDAGGTKTTPYSENPVGLVVFDASGNIVQYLSKPSLPKFAETNRLKGTDKEYREVMQGIIAGIGTYSVDRENLSIKWISSSFPNRDNTVENRTAKIAGDEPRPQEVRQRRNTGE